MSGTYYEYKKCTKQFIDWIIHTSKLVNSSCLRLPPTLSSLLTRVSVITSSSTTVKTENSHVQAVIAELGTILKVGAKAIKLREMVHNFHISQSSRLTSFHSNNSSNNSKNQEPSNNSGSNSTASSVVDDYQRSNDDHKFCIDRLKECYRLLTLWYRNNQPDISDNNNKTTTTTHSNHQNRFTTSFASININESTTHHSTSSTSIDQLDHCDNIFRVLADETESTLGGTASCCSGNGYQDMDLADSVTEYSTIRSVGASSPTPSTHSAATTCATESTLHGRGSETRTIDQIDQDFGDLRLTLICFMLDMMQLAEKVSEAWKKVRQMDTESNMYTACLETMTAIKLVTTLQAQVQLKYPSIVEVRDLFSAGLHRSLSENEITTLYNKNEFMNEFRSIAITLSSFSTSFKANTPVEERSTLVHRRGFFGTPFVESHFPLGTSLEDCMRFLPRELAELYNNHWDFQQVRKLMVNPSIAASIGATSTTSGIGSGGGITSAKDLPSDRLSDFPLTKTFLSSLIHQFESGHVSITESFTVYCWWKAILILQDRDNMFLSKHTYLNRKYMRSIDEKWLPYQECIDKHYELITSGKPLLRTNIDKMTIKSIHLQSAVGENGVLTIDRNRLMYQLFASMKPENVAMMRRVRQTIPSGILGNVNVYYYNPILSSSALIEKLLLNFRVNVLLLQDIPHIPRAICHLYRMLVQEGYLTQRSQVLEDFIKSYRSILFFGKDTSSTTTTKDKEHSAAARGSASNKEATSATGTTTFLVGSTKKGEYLTNYLLSENFTTQAIANLKASRNNNNSSNSNANQINVNMLNKKAGAKVHVGNVSDLFQVVYENDLSRLLNRTTTTVTSTTSTTTGNDNYSSNNSYNSNTGSEFDRILHSVKQCVNQEIFEQRMLNIDLLPLFSLLKDIAVGLLEDVTLPLGLISPTQLLSESTIQVTTTSTESLLSLKSVYDSTTTITTHALSVIDDCLPDVIGLKDQMQKIANVFNRELSKIEESQFYLLPREHGESLYVNEFGPSVLKMKRNVWIPAAMDKSRRAHERKLKTMAALNHIGKMPTAATATNAVTNQKGNIPPTRPPLHLNSNKSHGAFYDEIDEDEEVSQVLSSRSVAEYDDDDDDEGIDEIDRFDDDDDENDDDEEGEIEEEDEDDEEIMQTFFAFMDALQVLEVNLTTPSNALTTTTTNSKNKAKSNNNAMPPVKSSLEVDVPAIREELRQTIKKVPEIVKRFEPGMNTHNRSRYQTLLDFFVCGILQDEDMSEYILAQGGLLLRTPNCQPFGYSHLQLACLDGIDWAVSLLVKAGQGIDFDYRDKQGNTALHYAAIHNQMNLANTLIYAGANVECRNHIGQRPCDMIQQRDAVGGLNGKRGGNNVNKLLSNSIESTGADSIFEKYLKVLTGDLVQQEQAKSDITPSAQLRSQEVLNAKHSAHSKKVHKALRQEEEEHMKGTSKKVVTAEDLDRAERAKQELFAMLDDEEKAKEKSSSKKAGKKKNVNSGGSSKVSNIKTGESSNPSPPTPVNDTIKVSSSKTSASSWASIVTKPSSEMDKSNHDSVKDSVDDGEIEMSSNSMSGSSSQKKKKSNNKKKK